jgi:uncharacterized membrane-anchored protein YitT (DUF2179 family)
LQLCGHVIIGEVRLIELSYGAGSFFSRNGWSVGKVGLVVILVDTNGSSSLFTIVFIVFVIIIVVFVEIVMFLPHRCFALWSYIVFATVVAARVPRCR